MSLDLYEQETSERLSRLAPVQRPETGTFEGFFKGAGMSAMQTFAKTGARAASMAVGGAIVAGEQLRRPEPYQSTDTTVSDRFFKFHDDVIQRAADYWTPNPDEVGAAGQVVGQLLATIPMVIASPLATVAGTELSVAEDLSRKGVGTAEAVGVGAVQGAGLGLGVWMPILGNNLWQRVVVGGIGANAAQGIATRGVSEAILHGTPAADEFKAFDGSALTLDVLLGAAFGGLTHLSPTQRAQGKAAWDRIEAWGKDLKPSDVDAIAALRQAQHLNVDSTPGKPVAAQDIDAHVTRMRAAIDQLARNEPVNVEDLPAARVEADPVRQADSETRARELVDAAERVRVEEGIAEQSVAPRAEPIVRPDTAAQVRAPLAKHVEDPAIVEARSARIESSDLSTDGKTLLGDIFRTASEAKPSFDARLTAISEAVGARALLPGLKGIDRTISKIKGDYNGNPARMKDVLRATLEVDSLSASNSAVGAIARDFNVVKDGGRNLLDPASKPIDGYRDAKFNVTMENGAIAEVQVNIPEMLEAKKLAHSPYEERSAIERAAKEAGRDFTSEEQARVDALNAQMRAIYEPAWAAFLSKSRNADSDTGLPLRRADDGSNVRGGSTSQAAQNSPGTPAFMDTGIPSTSKNSAPGENLRPDGSISTSERSIAQEGADPLALEAERIAVEQPDLTITVGQDADGKPIRQSVAEYLAETREAVARAQDDVRLFEVAAACMLGRG